MPFDPLEWPGRLKTVEREYLAVRLTVDYFSDQLRRDPTLLEANLSRRDFQTAARLLEGTYLVRLFAEFETGLRVFWQSVKGTHPGAEPLINAIAARCKIDFRNLEAVHAVREYRNGLVHERERSGEAVTIHDARHHLCTFLSRIR